MKLKLLLILICSTFALSGQQFIGSIEVLDPLMEELISPSERIYIYGQRKRDSNSFCLLVE